MNRARSPAALLFALVIAAMACAGVMGLGGCVSGPPSFNEELRARTFDRYWDELENNYPFFDAAGPEHTGVDWADIRERYRPPALAAEHTDDFYHVMVGMLSELDDPHVSLAPPERPDEPAWTSPGLPLRAMVDRGWYITGWGDNPPATPPAAFMGREYVYPRLVRVEGQRPSITLVDDLLVGRPGTDVEIDLEWPDASITTHTIQRPVPVSFPPTPEGEKDEIIKDPALLRQIARLIAGRPVFVQRFDDIGYLRADTFDSDDALITQSELTEMLDKAVDEVIDCRGIILDLRNNPGGEARIMSDFVGRFTDRAIPMGEIRLPVFGIFPVTFEWEVRPRRPVCTARLAILTRPLTGSSAEHAAKLLRERGDCVIIGSRTAGAEAAVESIRGPDGSTLSYGRRRIVDAQGHGLQFVGVVPDVRIDMTREMLESMGAGAAGLELQNRRFIAALRALDAESLWPRFRAEVRELGGTPREEPDESLPELQVELQPGIRTR